MSSPTPRLTIVSPCFNEGEIIGGFIESVLRIADELRTACDIRLLIVDDGSRNGSLDRLVEWKKRDDRVAWLSLSRNFGHQAALTAGIDHAPPGAVLTMDCDMEQPPEKIPETLQHVQAGIHPRDTPCAPNRNGKDAALFFSRFSFHSVPSASSEKKALRSARSR